jgi:hypothetical protein
MKQTNIDITALSGGCCDWKKLDQSIHIINFLSIKLPTHGHGIVLYCIVDQEQVNALDKMEQACLKDYVREEESYHLLYAGTCSMGRKGLTPSITPLRPLRVSNGHHSSNIDNTKNPSMSPRLLQTSKFDNSKL